MKKKILKVLALVACAVLLVVGSIAGTLAYLKDSSTVTNTFTVGNVSITMDEATVNLYGEQKDANGAVITTRNDEGTGNQYKLIPSHTYVKDPTITVLANSEACYLFVKVENGIAAIEAEGNTTIANQMTANGWTPIATGSNVYYYQVGGNAVVATSTSNQEFVVFENFTLKTDANVADYANAKIIVTAYAVQADGFNADINAAWAAASAAQTQGNG